jgi:hypothetical protein
MSVPRGYRSLKGLCPTGEGECDFLVSITYLDHLHKYGPEWKFWNLRILPEVLGHPIVIFQGLKREDYDGGLCYSRRVARRFQGPSIELPPHPDTVAVVFVNPDHRGNIVLDWDWRTEDLDRPGWPENWQSDFGETIWPTN